MVGRQYWNGLAGAEGPTWGHQSTEPMHHTSWEFPLKRCPKEGMNSSSLNCPAIHSNPHLANPGREVTASLKIVRGRNLVKKKRNRSRITLLVARINTNTNLASNYIILYCIIIRSVVVSIDILVATHLIEEGKHSSGLIYYEVFFTREMAERRIQRFGYSE